MMILCVKWLTYLSRFEPLKVRQIGTKTGTVLVPRYRSQEGYMAPKPKSKPARFVFTVGTVLAMALTILMIMADRDLAQPSLSPIYHSQLLLLY